MEFSRVTSGFSMRFHPILQTWRQHLGTDYGAPTGTPVRSVGDGTVEFAGWQNGFGNVVHIRHSGDRTTVYAHLSRIDVKKGQKIERPSASARSAPPAGPPAPICTSNSASRACTKTPAPSPAPPRPLPCPAMHAGSSSRSSLR